MGKKLTQQKLAEVAEISPGTLSDILNGKGGPGWRVAKILARITGTEAKQWMDGSPSERRAMAQKYLGG